MKIAITLAALIFTAGPSPAAPPAETAPPAKAEISAEISHVKPSRQFGQQREDFRIGDKGSTASSSCRPMRPPAARNPGFWYAPTFVNSPGALPDQEHDWLFRQFLAHGMAIAGVNVGESFGNPAGRAAFTEFHRGSPRTTGWTGRPASCRRAAAG